jgi:L-threonylcarbamoyladenylate synthase
MADTYNTCQAEIFEANDKNISHCATKIQNGDLVIFPTETVYGIGANALNPQAIEKIYQYKKRPKQNPLIMHVISWEGAKIYTTLTEQESKVVDILTDRFWPGPLTILVKKSQYVPDIVTARSDWVALRSPENKVAQQLLENSMVPIVAPSANLSGKITSTSKEHLLEYFKNTDLSMLLEDTPSKVGIESTIVKIESNNITIVRPGIITIEDIENHLKTACDISLRYSCHSVETQSDYPGSSIQHYAPNIPTFLLNFIDYKGQEFDTIISSDMESLKTTTTYYLSQCACIDYNRHNFKYRDLFGAYVDLSETGEINEALFNLYNVLHQLNHIPTITRILIFNYWQHKPGLYNTMYDRIYRASNGQSINIPLQVVNYSQEQLPDQFQEVST